MERRRVIGPNMQPECKKTIYEVVELGVDETSPPETHAEEEILYVICGRGVLTGGGEPVDVQQEMGVYLAPNLKHFVTNTGEGPLRYLSMMARK